MLKLENISKKLGNFELSGINLEIAKGEYFILLGRSGSGKTQLLELIAGLNDPDSGEIWIDGANVTRSGIQCRNIGLVFQDYAIFPNMSVYRNIAYSQHAKRCDKQETDIKVRRTAEELNISHLLNRSTHNLSGGELQRVALARTLITSPKILLLDEPLASIDASLKDDIKKILRKLNKKGLTIVHVTHDYNEAVSLATRVGVLHNGRIIQSGNPEEVFGKPVNKFVARYSGIRNFFRVNFVHEDSGCYALCESRIKLRLYGNNYPDKGLLIVRSDAIRVFASEPDEKYENCFRGRVTDIMQKENGIELTIDAGEIFYADISLKEFKEMNIREMSEVWLMFRADAAVPLEGIV